MPILPPQSTFPYDRVETVLNFARAIANDAELSIAGDLLSDASPEILPFLNLGWREFQDELVNNGVETLTKECILTGVPPNLTNDPTTQIRIGFDVCFDGANEWPTPVLPDDLIEPLRLWQRQTGTNSGFTQMNPANDGLESAYPISWMGGWDWRGDGIYANGALVPIDLRVRYGSYHPDFAPDKQSGAFPSAVQIPILRSAHVLAYYVVLAFIRGRGADPDIRAELEAKRTDALEKMINRTARKKQRGNHRRRPYGYGVRSSIYGW